MPVGVRTILHYRSNVERHALREWQLRPEIDRVGSTAHIGLPGIGSSFSTATGFLFAAKGAANFGTRRPNVDIGNSTVGAGHRHKPFGLAHIKGEDGGRQARRNGVVQPDGFVEFAITHGVEHRRKTFA